MHGPAQETFKLAQLDPKRSSRVFRLLLANCLLLLLHAAISECISSSVTLYASDASAWLPHAAASKCYVCTANPCGACCGRRRIPPCAVLWRKTSAEGAIRIRMNVMRPGQSGRRAKSSCAGIIKQTSLYCYLLSRSAQEMPQRCCCCRSMPARRRRRSSSWLFSFSSYKK